MKSILKSVSLLAIVAFVAAMSGCVLEGESQVVLNEVLNVNFDERMESGDQRSEVICDQFRQQIEYFLMEHEIEPEDIVSVGIVSATYQVSRISQDNGPKDDFVISGYATVKRQDDPSGPVTDGPETLVNQTTQSILDARGMPTPADLNADGVGLLERAIYSLVVDGEDPRVIITLESQAIDPVPTPECPLDFKWRATIRLQVVVNTDV